MTQFSTIDLATGSGSTTPAYLATPDGDGPFPGIVLIHDITGLRPDTKRHCLKFAEAGYTAIAPDLFEKGKVSCIIRTNARFVRMLDMSTIRTYARYVRMLGTYARGTHDSHQCCTCFWDDHCG